MNMHEFLDERRLVPEGKKFAERGEWNGELTSMQETVVKSEEFWNQDKNIVIHGPTSSGKTLLAEIAALHQIQEEGKNVLFLVPLRVLVTSQCRQLQRDFEQILKSNNSKLKIFESSADYQDHDAEILDGTYDIAVIVYEKFFAMLNNSQNRMIDHCGLVVVDELQMLSSDDRGPKMEFSIMRVLEAQRKMRARGQSIRLIGMTTSESDVENVCRWLDAESLGNDVRPVSLQQYFVSCRSSTAVRLGEVRSVYIPGATGRASEERQPPLPLEITDSEEERGRDWNAEKNRCFFALLRRWMERPNEEDAKAKILIFSSAKRSVRFLANELRKKYPLFTSPDPADKEDRKKLQSALNDALNEFGDEDDISNLSTLIQHGIAFHHSGLPSTVREAIEDDFRSKSGQIQVIVCTETLMIGVNLPADVVILYDNTVFRGEPLPRKLTLQEYKNFIGRAGRLGMSNGGESYMLTEQLRHDFDAYTSTQKTKIVSPFQEGSQKEITPYFLSWIGNSENAEQRIQSGLEQGFCCNQKPKSLADIEGFAQKILSELKKLKKKNTDGNWLSLVEEDNNGLDPVWRLTTLGRYLAPYALTLNTDVVLLNYVIRHRDALHTEQLRLEMSGNKEPVPSAALLELLYAICKCEEVDKNPVLQLPNNKEDQIRELGRRVKSYLRKIYKKPSQSCADRKSLAQIAYMESVLEDKEVRAATRAVILALWMAGCSIGSIRQYTNFNISINTSDVERLSEAVAYLMEAVSNCQKAVGMDEADSHGMYALSTSMKYGVPRPLVPLANLHTRKVTRPFLLRIGEKAKAAGKTPVEYILASTEEKYKLLQKDIREREYSDNYKQQIENRTLEIPDKFNSLLTVLGEFDCGINADAAGVYNHLKEFFETLRCIEKKPADSGIQVHDEEAGLQIQFSCHGGGIRQIYFKTLHPVLDEDNPWTEFVCEFRNKVREEAAKAGIHHTRSVTVLCGAPPASAENLPADELVISSEMLGVLLLACLLENTSTTNDLICRILSDLQGNFILGGSGFFNGYGQLWELVKGYSLPPVHPEDEHIQLFYYPGLFDSKRGVLPKKEDYIEFPWGYAESCGHSRASFYHPAMQYSRQSKITLQHSSIIFCNDEDAEQVRALLSTDVAVYVRDPEKGMDELLLELAKSLSGEQPTYDYEIGISFRGTYSAQMQALREQLEQRGKTVLCMATEEFERQVGGGGLHDRLHDMFSQCRHIIACDTADYDLSSYTLVEFNVIVDKLSYALKNRERVPIHLVEIPGMEHSRKLSNFFRYDFIATYREDDVAALAETLIGQMDQVDHNNQDTALPS